MYAIIGYNQIKQTGEKPMTTFKTTAQDFNKTYSDIYFTKGNLKGHYCFDCATTRISTDIIKAPNGKYDITFSDMDNDYQTIDKRVRPTLKAAKESVINFLNAKITELNLETMSETDTAEDIRDVFSIDAIDDQLFSNNSIDDIVGIDVIDEQLFDNQYINIDIDDLIEDDTDFLASYTFTAVNNVIPIGFIILKNDDNLMSIFARNTIAQIWINGKNRLSIIWHDESLPGINNNSTIEIINKIINDPDDLLFGKDIKVNLV